MKTAFKYIRVSSQLQDTQRQHLSIDKYCSTNGITILQSFEEKESGTKKTRKALTAMLSACQTTKPDYIIIDELTRLGRTSQALATIEELTEQKICLYTIKENLFSLNQDLTENTDAILSFYVNAGIAKNELVTLKRRMKGGYIAAAQRGQFQGGGSKTVPYGYKLEIKQVNNTNKYRNFLVINDFEANYVREIYKRSIGGEGIHKIAVWLNTTDFKTRTGVNWKNGNVLAILKNRLNTGVRVMNGQEINSYPQIITEETYQAAQMNLSSRKNARENHKIYNYLFDQGLVKCGCCGRNFFAHKVVDKKTGKTDKNNVYKCSSRLIVGGRCDNVGVNIDKLESTVQHLILKYLPEQIQNTIDTSEIDGLISNLSAEIEMYKNSIEAESKKEAQLLDALLNGVFSPDVIKAKSMELKERKQEFEQIIKVKTAELQKTTDIKANALNLPKLIEQLKVTGIDKQLINRLVEVIEITPSTEKLTAAKNEKSALVEIKFYGGGNMTYIISQRTAEIKLLAITGVVIEENRTKHQILKEVADKTTTAKGLIIDSL